MATRRPTLDRTSTIKANMINKVSKISTETSTPSSQFSACYALIEEVSHIEQQLNNLFGDLSNVLQRLQPGAAPIAGPQESECPDGFVPQMQQKIQQINGHLELLWQINAAFDDLI